MVAAHSHSLALFSLIPIVLASPYRLDSPHAQGFRWLSPHHHRAATPVLPSGWSYTNCYSDPSSARVLSTKIYSGSLNSQDYCVAQCNAQNYNYAGVEYGVECWCGNILTNPMVTTTCTMACPGDSTQKCGDGNKIGLFTKTTTVSSAWTSLGCFVDQDDRTLKGAYYTDSAMTPVLCQTKCSAAGYSMAGTEYGTQCYCSNSLSKNVGSSSCRTACGGDSSQYCGGAWALNIYQKTTSTGTTTTTTSTTTTASTTSTTSSTSTTSTTSTTSVSSTSTTSSTSSSASATPTWTSLGCIADQSARTLDGPSYTDATNMTPAFCQAKCAAGGYTYAGVEYGSQCYCGNTLTNGGKTSGGCTSPCAGDKTLICGGGWTLNVFKLTSGSTSTTSASSSTSSSSSSSSSTTSSSSTSSVSTTSTTSATPTSSASYGWSTVGCVVDQDARTLNAKSYTDAAMTPALCQSTCYAAGYTYAGTEYSTECYCGNTLTNGGTSSTGCTSTCAGNNSLICGGSWALTVYKYGVLSASSSTTSTTSSTSSSISTSSTTSSTISSTTTTTSATPTPTYTSLGCYRDSYNRVLSQGQGADTSTRTIQSCLAQCASLGYCYAGLETGSECWCNDSLLTSSDSGSKLSMDQCQMTCTGNSSQYCGGSWSLEIYYDGTKSKCKGPPTTSVSSSSSTSTTTTTTSTATSTQSNGLWYRANGSNTGKVIMAHVIVGNTYSYTKQQWTDEIKMASAQGIDAFALNFGYDSWQAGQMDSAYDAASSSGTGFKMLLSFDFTVLGCGDNNIITTNINKYKNHAAQLKDSSGNMWITTFDGGSCRSDSSWNSVLRNNGIGIKFVPAFFNDETNTKMKEYYPSINGDFLWGGAWPKANNLLDWSEDDYRISRSGLTRPPDVYMTTVAPLFFVHYSGRNAIWRSDDHLYARRWEDLFSHRSVVDAVQIVTWNDYGESTYIGPIGKDMPSGTTWVTGFDHTPFLQMTGYYAWAFKTGQYPTITSDKIFFWGRPHPKGAGANDGIGKPNNWDWTTDNLWIVLFSTGSGSLQVTMGSSSPTFSVSAGVNKFTLPLTQASSVTAVLTRNGSQVFRVQGAVTYTNSPSAYNWNYAAAAGP